MSEDIKVSLIIPRDISLRIKDYIRGCKQQGKYTRQDLVIVEALDNFLPTLGNRIPIQNFVKTPSILKAMEPPKKGAFLKTSNLFGS